MLSAAAVALLSGPALATDEIKTVLTKAVKTSTASSTGGHDDILIDSSGGITFNSATTALLTLDSNNNINNGGTLDGSNQDSQTAVAIDANGLTGSFLSNGAIKLTGSGATKKAVYLTGSSSFTGLITLDAGSTVSIVGDKSNGVISDSNTVLNGDWILGGVMNMTPTTANSGTASGITMVDLLGTTNGNVVISSGAVYTAIGNGSQGIVLSGAINHCNTAVVPTCTEIGTFANSGIINVAGVATRDPTKNNAEGGSALVIQNSINGGILNNGPANPSDGTAAASIEANGVVSTLLNTPTVVISPSPLVSGGQMTIGVDTADAANNTYSFINRGSIAASPEDPNISAEAIQINGTASIPVVFQGQGLLNSGTIVAGATSKTPGTPVSATALEIGSYVTLPTIHVSSQNNGGSISAIVSGPQGGIATAISIDGAPVSVGGIPVNTTTVSEIDVDLGSKITAAAQASIPTGTSLGTLSAIAIKDRSNSLVTLNNSGQISAGASLTDATTGATLTLADGTKPLTLAVDTSFNTTGLNFTNKGSVSGDVLFGSGSDTYTIVGADQNSVAIHSGAINFGFSSSGTTTDPAFSGAGDFLHVGQFANVAGAITGQGTLDVQIDGTGTLTVQNIGTTLATRSLVVAGGTTSNGITNAGTLNISVSPGVTTLPVITATNAALGVGSQLHVTYGSFITQSGSFILIQTPALGLHVSAADVARYSSEVDGSNGGTLPFLFSGASITLQHTAANDNLLLQITAKNVDQLGLTGYARQIQPFANVAIAKDTDLGAAMIAGINSAADAQKAYDAFAPDVSGGVRAVAISLTDQATGVVAARLRNLRLFDKEQGELTLWGNQFGEYLSTHGQTVKAITAGGAAAGQNAPTGGCTPACSTVSLNGFKDHGFGFSLGVDEGSPAGGWYGAAFTFYTGDVAELSDRTSKTQTLWYLLTGYTTWRGKGLFVDSQVNVGYGDFKGKRVLTLDIPKSAIVPADTTFTREADSKRAGLVASFGVTMGAMMKYGPITSIPQLSLDGMTLREEGFTETNGGVGMNLTVNPYYANSLRVFLGDEFRANIDVGDFFLQPAVRLGYRFDFLNDPVKLHAQFADDPSTLAKDPGGMFTITGPDPARGNVVAGAALNATTENWTIGLNYDFVRGSNNATEQVGTLSLLGRI